MEIQELHRTHTALALPGGRGEVGEGSGEGGRGVVRGGEVRGGVVRGGEVRGRGGGGEW